MSEEQVLYDFIVRCHDNSDRVGFTFVDGREFLGWIAEVTEDRMLVMWAPSPFYAQATGGDEWNPDDEWVPFTALRTESLARYDKSIPGWVYHLPRQSSRRPAVAWWRRPWTRRCSRLRATDA
jgi:hypothetical protein